MLVRYIYCPQRMNVHHLFVVASSWNVLSYKRHLVAFSAVRVSAGSAGCLSIFICDVSYFLCRDLPPAFLSHLAVHSFIHSFDAFHVAISILYFLSLCRVVSAAASLSGIWCTASLVKVGHPSLSAWSLSTYVCTPVQKTNRLAIALPRIQPSTTKLSQ